MTNPWLARRVLCYAHQGGAREGPSSTMWALEHAVAAGADALELDVHATVDGRLVVCHDATVDRTTEASGAIAAMTLEELRRLDNAYWWVPGEVVDHERGADEYPMRGRAPVDPSLRIATLEEVLEAFPHTFLNLDIKQTAPLVAPYEETLAKVLRDYGRVDDVIVASFNDAATDAFRRFAPEIGTSAGTLAVAEFWRAVHHGGTMPALAHVALQVPVETAGITVLDDAFVVAAHEHGVAVHAWTIDEPDDMAGLVRLGVDAIMSDVPSVVVDVVTRAGARYAPPSQASMS
ncbi:MAG: glycerophosphodiester phosphodiesterase [Acidimicrobiales bacterium]